MCSIFTFVQYSTNDWFEQSELINNPFLWYVCTIKLANVNVCNVFILQSIQITTVLFFQILNFCTSCFNPFPNNKI